MLKNIWLLANIFSHTKKTFPSRQNYTNWIVFMHKPSLQAVYKSPVRLLDILLLLCPLFQMLNSFPSFFICLKFWQFCGIKLVICAVHHTQILWVMQKILLWILWSFLSEANSKGFVKNMRQKCFGRCGLSNSTAMK